MRQITPDEAFAERLREVRENARMTRAQLVDRLMEVVGYEELSEQAIGAIERKGRRVSLSDAFALAAALGVAPINLMAPFEKPEPIVPNGRKRRVAEMPTFEATAELKVGENVTLIPGWARAWIKGVRINWEADPSDFLRYYVTEVPPARRWLIEETASAIVAGDNERKTELGRLKLAENEPHRPASHRAGRELGLPAPIWSLLTRGQGNGEEQS